MDRELLSTLSKVGLPLAVIVLVLAVAARRGIRLREDLGLFWPKPAVLVGWIGVWVVWIAAGEAVTNAFGLAQAQPWKPYAPLVVILRIAAIGVVGPASEEILMRGMLFFRLRGTRLGPAGAVVATAAAWAALHLAYDWKTRALVFADGLLLGAARHRSGSTNVPIVMHSLGNLFSIWQSLNL